MPKSLPSGSHDDKGTNLDQRSHFAETPKAPGNHAPAVCPPLSLYRYLAYPYLHEMRALGLPALVLPPGTPSASVPPTKSPCPSAESGVPTPPGPADSPTHENLAPRRESLPSADSSISLSPSAPACSSSEDDMESGVDLLGLARASRRYVIRAPPPLTDNRLLYSVDGGGLLPTISADVDAVSKERGRRRGGCGARG